MTSKRYNLLTIELRGNEFHARCPNYPSAEYRIPYHIVDAAKAIYKNPEARITVTVNGRAYDINGASYIIQRFVPHISKY